MESEIAADIVRQERDFWMQRHGQRNRRQRQRTAGSRPQGRNFHAQDLNPRPTDRAVVTRPQLGPFVDDETAALRRGLAFERAHFSPNPLNGGSPDADGRCRLPVVISLASDNQTLCSDADLTEIETENRIHRSAYSLSGWQLSTSLQKGVPPYESKPTPAQFLKSRNRRAVGPCKNSCPGGRSLA
jgi:hypothetical protein